jgi:DNA-directed RNA polymerase specialized sigma subunit
LQHGFRNVNTGSDQGNSAKNLESKEIPRAQLHAAKPLERIFARQGEKGIVRAYKEHGYRIREIAAHLGVHYATVSQRLKQLEQAKWDAGCGP